MFGLDERIAELAQGDAIVLVLAVSLLLALRHATDPDHLTAVSTLIVSEDQRGSRRAGVLGLAWGLGHATTLSLLGLPIVLFEAHLPEIVQRAAEVAIGLVIVALALRVLMRWRRGAFHAHEHAHGDVRHRHLHAHSGASEPRMASGHDHEHEPASQLGRSPAGSYAIGLVHGIGGSSGVSVLLLAAIPEPAVGLFALAVFAVGTAVSMAVLSWALGYGLTRGPVARRLVAVAPALGVVSLLFGVWYALGALEAVPYPL